MQTMSENLQQTLLDVALQLQEQLKFYREIGLTDVGDSLRDERFLSAQAEDSSGEAVAAQRQAVTPTVEMQPEIQPLAGEPHKLPDLKPTGSPTLPSTEGPVMAKKQEPPDQDLFS